jgi:hypothetical protein
LIQRIATAQGIDTEGLVKTPEQLQAEQQAAIQQQQQQQMAETAQAVTEKTAPKVVDNYTKPTK